MPHIQTNIRNDQHARLIDQLAENETVSGFTAAAILRETPRRERGGNAEPLARKAGKPKKGTA